MFSSRRIAVISMIAAVYVVLVLILPWLSYGPIQVRIAEALTILPVITPVAIWGVALGCFVANLIGWLTGANPIGAIDTVFGTAASIIAGIITYRLRGYRIGGLPILSALSPVLVNAIIVGAQLTVIYYPGNFNLVTFGTFAMWVGLGQVIACMALGLPLLKAFERRKIMADI